MKTLFLDIETDMKHEKIWCCCTMDMDTLEQRCFLSDESFRDYVSSYDIVVAHNGIGFDFPVLKDVWNVDLYQKQLCDTLLLSRLANPIRDGGHSLANWGKVLGDFKGDFTDFDGGLSDEMIQYCQQDVVLLSKVYHILLKELAEFSQSSIQLEHEVALIIEQQKRNGMYVDMPLLQGLIAELDYKVTQIEGELQQIFPPRVITNRVNKRTNAPLKDIVTPFNPGSRQQIAERLMERGWKPKKFTEKGSVIVDEEVLMGVDIPEAKKMAEYLLLQKRLSQTKSWLEAIEDDGRIHGSVITIGAVTNRMAHNSPNMAQVPAVRSPYGVECRSVFRAEGDKILVDADLAGLELRCFAHYLNDKDYTNEVVNGDVHTRNQHAFGVQTRDQAKTTLYAMLYSAGPAKLGNIVGGGEREGKRMIDNFRKALPAYAILKDKVEKAAQKGWLVGLDGRKIWVRSSHAALNTLLQSAGAIIAKKALVIVEKQLSKRYSGRYKFICNIHDEFLIETDIEIAEDIGMWLVWGFEQAGKALKLNCPITGEYKVGKTWAEVH